MTKRAADKIMRGLREALAFAKGDASKARVTTFVECHDCGNLIRKAGHCSECGARLYSGEGKNCHDN